MLKFLALGEGGVSRQGVKTDGTGLTFDQDGIDLEPGEIGRFGAGCLTADDIDLENLARALEPGGDVHLVADRRIVESAQRTQIADAALARIEPDAKTHRLERASLSLRVRLRQPSFRATSVRRIASAAPTACLA